MIEPGQRHRAERLVLAELRRYHRTEPLGIGMRVDALVDRVLDAPVDRRPAGHRGAGRLELDAAGVRLVVDELGAAGRVHREGRRISLPDHVPALDPEMAARVDALLSVLRAAGASPPRAERPAARLGVPESVLSQLRRSGALVAAGPGIDYPADTWADLQRRMRALAPGGRPSIARVRDAFGTSRRHAAAIRGRDRQAVR